MNARTLNLLLLAALAAFCLLAPQMAIACPTCKDQIAADPSAANVARGYFYSILFMLSMPPLILAGMGGYFYYEIRKARAEQAKAAEQNTGAIAPQA